MVTHKKQPLVYEFEVLLPPHAHALTSKKTTRLKLYPDHLILKTKPSIEIQYNDILDVKIKKDGIYLNYTTAKDPLRFIIPGSLKRFSCAKTSQLFIELIESLKNKNYCSWIIDSLKEEDTKNKKISFYISFFLIASILLFTGSFLSILTNCDYHCIVLLLLALGCLGIVLLFSFLGLWADYLFQWKLAKIEHNYLMADKLIDLLEAQAPTDQETKTYYLSKILQHLEKIIKIDAASEYVEEIRKRMSNNH